MLKRKKNQRDEERWSPCLHQICRSIISRTPSSNSTCHNMWLPQMDPTALTIELLLVKSLPSRHTSSRSNSPTQLATPASTSRSTKSKNKKTRSSSKTRYKTNAQPCLASPKMRRYIVSTTQSASPCCKTAKSSKVWCTKTATVLEAKTPCHKAFTSPQNPMRYPSVVFRSSNSRSTIKTSRTRATRQQSKK